MNLIGSRCGGYDFNIFFNGINFWIGQTKDSDHDYFIGNKDRPNLRGDFWGGVLGIYFGVAVPYINDFGKLQMPKTMDFISLIMEKKFLARKLIKPLYCGQGKDIFIYSKNLDFISKIKFQPRIMPRCLK